MVPLQDDRCLALYECGVARHAIDRALLLVASTEDGADWADAPLGRRDARLIELRCAWFGPRFDAVVACPACRELLNCALDLRHVARSAAVEPDAGEVRTAYGRFRSPTSRDLAVIAAESDPFEAARELLRRLALDDVPAEGWTDEAVAQIERALEESDPLAYVSVALHCAGCAHDWNVALDIGASLWEELAAQARETVEHVHLLAGAYGWSESEIFALPPARRRLYLQRVLS